MLFDNKYRVESTRLRTWDYSSPGYYFITICTHNHKCYFGHVQNRRMLFSPIGTIAKQYFIAIPDHFPNVIIDACTVMPNHVHGIIRIVELNETTKNPGIPVAVVDGVAVVETQNVASLQNPKKINGSSEKSFTNRFGPQSKNLSSIVRGYKIGVKKWCVINTMQFEWQPRFHDHIIRNDRELFRIRQYIKDNPVHWEKDILNT